MLATPDFTGSHPRAYALSNTPPHRVADRKGFPFGMPRCRIYQPSASVMQPSGRTKREWLLEFEPAATHWIEPLMGWTASDGPAVRLPFATRSAAIDYAERHGIDYEVIDQPPRRAGRPLTVRAEGDRARASLCALPKPWLPLATATQQ
jgi:hypothetical protein